jgi:hypothetical protein
MGQITEGQRINFTILNEPQGLQAVELAPADGPAGQEQAGDAEEPAEAADQEETKD